MSCLNCRKAQVNCVFTAHSRRPFYYTSEEKWEYMNAIVQSLIPGAQLTMDNLTVLREELKRHPINLLDACGIQGSVPSNQNSQMFLNNSQNTLWNQKDRKDVDSNQEKMLRLQKKKINQNQSQELLLPGRIQESCRPESILDGNGSLIFDEHGKKSYIGESGVLSFRIKMREFLLTNKPQTNDNIGAYSVETKTGFGFSYKPLQQQKKLVLPDREEADVICDLFFNQIQSVIWIIPRTDFQYRYDVSYLYGSSMPTDLNWVCSLYLIFALGYWLQDQEEKSNTFYDLAKELLNEVLEESSEASVRTLMLLSVYLQNGKKRNQGFTHLATAIRIAQSLGLHRDIEKVWKEPIGSLEDPNLAEPRKQLWWSLVGLELISSTSLGRPSALTENIGDVPLPSESTLFLGAHTPMGYFHGSSMLSQILCSINRLLYNDGQGKTTNRKENAELLLGRLKAWSKAFPLHRIYPTTQLDSHVRALAFLNLFYNYCVTLTTRPFLFAYAVSYPAKNNQLGNLDEECAMAAIDSLRTLNHLKDRNLLFNFWFDHFYIMNATVCLSCVAKTTPQYQIAFRSSINLLRELKPKGTGASMLHGAMLLEQAFNDALGVSHVKRKHILD